ncbi:carboxymuconolactone decarboxylase family protein [Variovorax ureilyticus]|uniref:Carboxymuconolactone decarboxylase family protein n=1 Tax=Variovorax ureilyticus TaxID=1836198 RepID=A0ABU8V9M0_9BURK
MNTKPADTAEAERIKDYFIAERGYWRPWTETMLQACPGFVEQYARYAGYPARTGPLTERMVELIYIALDSSSSHLFQSGLQTHMKRALEVGATQADIFDVLHLVAVQGAVHTCQAADILAEFTGGKETAVIDGKLQARIESLGSAHALSLAAVARMDPGYAHVLLDFIEQGRPGTGLSPGERSLVQLALHACFTAFNPDAIRRIVPVALSQGLAPAELLQAIQLGAHLAVHGTALGANVFRQSTAPAAEQGS